MAGSENSVCVVFLTIKLRLKVNETKSAVARPEERKLLLSVIGVGETLAASLLAEMPEPGVLRRSGEMVAYAGLNPSHHRSGTSINRPTRISKIGNAALRSSLYMPALSAMRFNPAVRALVVRLKQAGRLQPKQIVVAAMRKLLVLCFATGCGFLKAVQFGRESPRS
jgi:transposase